MSPLTIASSRFDALEIEESAVIEFPIGLIGLGGHRWAIVGGGESPFRWLHSVDDPALALPVVNPWDFFADYEVALSDEDTARVGSDNVAVWVTVRTGGELTDFSANLKAPIVVAGGRGHQIINGAAASVRAPLFPAAAATAA